MALKFWRRRRGGKKRYTPFQVFPERELIKYNIREESGQRRYVRTIYLHGFQRLPTGLSPRGFGFTGPAGYFLGDLGRTFRNMLLEVHIVRKGAVRIEKLQRKVKVFFEYSTLLGVLRDLKLFNRERNKKSSDLAGRFLESCFPRYFRGVVTGKKADTSYKKDQIADALRKKGALKNLSENDVNSLADFYPGFLKAYSSREKVRSKRLLLTRQSKVAGESVYLGNVIREFESRLNSTTHEEERWQQFLKEHILLFNTNYSGFIERENISLSGDYPDFLLIDVYEYIDIYEIKKPNTQLLSRDISRSNYYWSTEISKAIAQVENYIEQIQRYQDALTKDIRDKTGMDIRVVKPRGYIIAGTRSQLAGQTKRDGFQVLNGSLKNIEVILYDDFLGNLKNLLKRIREGTVTT